MTGSTPLPFLDLSSIPDQDEDSITNILEINPLKRVRKDEKYREPMWFNMIERAVKAIVSIRFSHVNSFDTETSGTAEGTGFIVDIERGIMLTNRHIIGSGPFVGEAILHNHEEIDVYPIYRDPIHDFGFLKFDPKHIRYQDLISIPLRPELTKVGLEVRVVGNDAGEKLSILQGSISRLNRNAPNYGELSYCDFNTFYIQAAANNSGGSSGSPVLDIYGNAVALQAGGRSEAATDFFLPLDRVKRALSYIQQGSKVPRGTIQTQFLHRTFDEIRRLGLRASTETKIRTQFQNEIGMLTCEVILPGGPASQYLQTGDVLVAINGKTLTSFPDLETALDDNVDRIITVEVERGGEPLEFVITVQDMHKITPDRYLLFSGASFNNLSYQLARPFGLPVKGVYINESGGPFKLNGNTHGMIVKSVDAQLTPDLETFIEVVKQIPDGKLVVVVYYLITDVHTVEYNLVKIDRHWCPFKLAIRDDSSGKFNFIDLDKPIPALPIEPKTTIFPKINLELNAAKIIRQSIVKVTYQLASRIEGFSRSKCHGGGIILDKELGILAVSRNCVPYDLGDITLTFAESILIPAKVKFLHPTHGYTLLQYDPKLIGNTEVKAIKFSDVKLEQGQTVNLVGFNPNFKLTATTTSVSDLSFVTIPEDAVPRYRAMNIEAITVDSSTAQRCNTGVLCDNLGQVQAIWMSFLGDRKQTGQDNEYHFAIDISSFKLPLQQCREPELPLYYANFELNSCGIVHAKSLGIPDDFVDAYDNVSSQKELYQIRKLEVGTPAHDLLQELDVIMYIDDTLVTSIRHFDCQFISPTLNMTVLRNKEVVKIQVPTSLIEPHPTKRVVFWAGATFHEPHQAVLQQSKNLPSRIYVSSRDRGSPAYMYGLGKTMWVTAINDRPTYDLDDLLNVVSKLPDTNYVRVKVVTFDNLPSVLSIKPNLHYWSTVELVKDATQPTGWLKIEH